MEHLHFVLSVANNLKMHISGKATIKGGTISARNLDASFGELILESVKDIEKSQAMGINLGLSADQNDKLKSIGGSYSKGLREIVAEVTSIIGSENIKIVVAHALHLNGAMIANAKRNEDGSYTDLGKLELTAGQLFVKHIHQLDEGITFGASVNFARNKATEQDKLGERNNIYKVTFGMHDGDGTVFATLGNGKVIIGDIQGDQLNHDINKVNTGIDYSIKIDTLHMHFQGRDKAAEDRVKNRFKEKGASGIFAEEADYVYTKASDMFGFGKQDLPEETANEDETYEEEIIDLDEEDTKEQKNNPKPDLDSDDQTSESQADDDLSKLMANLEEKKDSLKKDLMEKHGLTENQADIAASQAVNDAKKTADYQLKHNGLTPAFAPVLACANPACVEMVILFSALVVDAIVLYTKTYYYKAETDQGETIWVKKKADSSSSQQQQNKQKLAGTYGTPPDPDDWEPDKKFEKHNDFDRKTCKYKDSEAHTNGFKDKSPAPKDGQKNLPNSYRFSESGRVAVDIENNEIIIFRRTGINEYHGYVIKPETLVSQEHGAAALLRSLRLIGKKGNIIPK